MRRQRGREGVALPGAARRTRGRGGELRHHDVSPVPPTHCLQIDSIGSARSEGGGGGGGDSEVQRTMLELLNQLDGFEPTQNIKVVMATNRIDILDPALLR